MDLNRVTARFGEALSQSFERVRSFDTGASRRDQLLAAMLLPFFLVVAMAVSVVVKDVLLGLVPAGVSSVEPIMFLLGFVLVVATFAAAFAWVKTGGFGLFE